MASRMLNKVGIRQRSLFHVLHSFSLHCSQCGYCQGMGPIAAMLLCYMAPERAYASLVHLHDAYRMHDIFSPGFPGLLESIYVQERITEEMMPEVYAAFKKHIVSTTSYATKWYITLFANSIPYQTHLRLWDVFLLEGPDLFVIVAVSIIWVHRGMCVHFCELNKDVERPSKIALRPSRPTLRRCCPYYHHFSCLRTRTCTCIGLPR